MKTSERTRGKLAGEDKGRQRRLCKMMLRAEICQSHEVQPRNSNSKMIGDRSADLGHVGLRVYNRHQLQGGAAMHLHSLNSVSS